MDITRVRLKKIEFWAKKSYKDFIIIILLFISARASAIVHNEIFLTMLFLISGLLFIINKQNFDFIIIIMLLAWVLINSFVSLIFQSEFNKITFLGFIIRLLYPYFLLKLVGGNFFLLLEKWIFRLSIITIPFYVLQLIYPQIFNYLQFMNFAIPEQFVRGGWYGFVFMKSSWAGLRNSGFMWEPGGFAYILSVGLLLRLIYDNFEFNSKHLIYIMLILTTQSTTGYLTLIVFSLLYVYNHDKRYLLFAIPMIAIIIYAFYDLPFLYPKIQKYLQLENKIQEYGYSGYRYPKAGRLSIFFLNIKELVSYPLGYGINWDVRTKNYFGENLVGANGFANFIIRWGIFGIYLIIFALFKFFKKLKKKYEYKGIIFAMLIILLEMNSNPVSRDPIIYSFIFYPFIRWSKKNNK